MTAELFTYLCPCCREPMEFDLDPGFPATAHDAGVGATVESGPEECPECGAGIEWGNVETAFERSL